MFIRTDLQSPIFLYSFFLSSVVLLSFQAKFVSVCVWVVRAVFNIGDEDENSLVSDLSVSSFFGMATGGVNQYYRPVDPLVLDGPAHLISERWRKWKRSFLFFISAQDITDPDRKHSFLLHFAGEAVQDLFETLSEPVPAVDDRFERTIAMLEKHFNVEKNTLFERHCFRQMAPTAGETVDKFVARLRLQAQHCSFADLEDQLRDQLVEKINPPALRRKLLEQSSIKLQDALKLARSRGKLLTFSHEPCLVTRARTSIVCLHHVRRSRDQP